ncbi:aldo/keto reductase [Spongisporangium articulatum]|uniref:Aldo/keto reductase n=1 Tax=Spongisporangium articulatum TaxID=3362603 RepID=A0ABW8ALG3_9ACTN
MTEHALGQTPFPQRQLGTGGPLVGAVGLGCMGMSQSYGSPDDTESLAALNRAIDLGVTLIDTADVYGAGANERLIGPVVSRRREEIVLATKCGFVADTDPGSAPGGVDGRPEHVREAIRASLRRLGVEHVDLYYLHRVDPDVPVEETIGAFGELVREGLIGHVGISEASPENLRRAHATYPISALQSEWSLFTRGLEVDVVPVCRELGITVVPFSPLGRGLLTGTVTSVADLPENDMRKSMPRFADGNLDANLALVAEVQSIAGEHDATAGQVALAWLLAQGADVVPIPGTKRVKYVEENAAAATLALTDSDLARLDTLRPAGARYPEGSFAAKLAHQPT